MQKNFDHHLRLNNVYSSKNHGTETTRFYDLITGDGAFDCQDHFDQQEELVFKIIFAEIRTGLRFLKSNRNMVVKFFTFTDCRTISLLYFLSKFFRDIICYKPIASRASNSEVYVVCRGFYHEHYQNFGEKILSTIEDIPDRMILDLEIIDNEFIENLENLNNSLFDRQMNSINRNIQLFNSMNEQNRHEIEDGKILLARQFIEHFRIVNISMNENLTISSVLTTNRRRVHKQQKFYLIKLKYSFQSNKVPEFKTIKKIFITNDYYRGQSLIFNENKLQSFRLYHCNVEQFSFGQRFDEINNSKFVCNYLLKTFIWFKSICANKVFNKRLSYKNNLVDKKFDDFLQKYLHDKTIVEGDRCSLGSLMMNHSTVDFINNNIFDKKLSESERISQVHFIDLAINNDGDGCLALNTKDFEFCTEFRAKIQNLIRIIKPNDCLVLQTKPLLSRLSVGMLLLILTRFRNFLFQTVAIGNHLRLVCILDQYCSPNDSNSELLFQKFFDISNTNYWNDSLMEIFAVPSILANHRFSEAIWIANSHYLYLLLKSITEEWGEQIEMIINEDQKKKKKKRKLRNETD
ncbi:hypothetical protein SSS_10262 [Sarcoptes scabiei]|nr:hypothetical protein SSS_10262 [Sarcoptes scabiei]